VTHQQAQSEFSNPNSTSESRRKALKILENKSKKKYENKYKNTPPQFRPGTWGISAK
jgi:hypothetical protein